MHGLANSDPRAEKHFHAVLFLNKDVYHSLGDFKALTGNLSAMICQAWCSALSVPFDTHKSLVHFPIGGLLYVDANNSGFMMQRVEALKQANYLAKVATKHYGDGERSFGCSR